MCGLAGYLDLGGEPASRSVLENMARAIAHRGPDGQGNYIDRNLGLAHRRLSIIDLSDAAGQPMTSSDGRYTIAYNGEVYNFPALRDELESAGHQFRSRSDTEVVLTALATWGEAAVTRFNGMFAFAFWDRERRQLLLARDRYGIKPLYMWRGSRTLLFASEIKAFLTHPEFRAGLDATGLLEYMTFQNFFTDKTLFSGVRLLAPGTVLRIDARRDGAETRWRYWDFSFAEPTGKVDEAEQIEELDRLFRQAVSRQLVSDVDVGAYLSGGIDSGSVTALAAKELPYIKSFTCGFDLNSASGVEMGFDERAPAEYMSYLFKTEHYEMVLKAGDMERVLPRLAWHLEEPRVGQCYPNFYAAQLASRFVKVVLSGAGGDEIFAGYPWRYYRAVVNTDFDHYVDKYYAFWQRLIPAQSMSAVLRPVWNEVKDISTRQIFRDVFHRHAPELSRPEDYINHSLYFEAKTFLHGLLVVEDKMSMAHSLETRIPFLDNDLVDFAARIPAAFKLGNLTEVVRLNENEPGRKTLKYFQKTRDGKRLLRKVMERYVPQAITDREKQGFSAPDASWFKGESIDYVKRVLFNPNARVYEYLDREAVQVLVDDHLSGRENRRLLIWSLLNLEAWFSRFLN